MTIKLKDLFRCYASGIGIRSLCPMFGLSRNTVRQYVRKFCESGITLEQLQSMSEHHLQEMFCESKKRERKPSPRQVQLEALLPDYAARLKHKGVTVRSLYEEYKREHPQTAIS